MSVRVKALKSRTNMDVCVKDLPNTFFEDISDGSVLLIMHPNRNMTYKITLQELKEYILKDVKTTRIINLD